MWQALHSRIPTCVLLSRRGVILSSLMCSLCGEEEETAEHLFISCSIAANILLNLVLGFVYNHFLHSPLKILWKPHTLYEGTNTLKRVHVMVMATVWSIWKHQNKVTFDRTTPSVNIVMLETLSTSSLRMKARSRNKTLETLLGCLFDPG